jgi:hypothetical protein
MKRRLPHFLFQILVMHAAAGALAQAPLVSPDQTPQAAAAPARPLTRADLDRFVAWYQGRWENEAQSVAQVEENVPLDGRIERLTHWIAPLEHKGFGRVSQAPNPRDVRFLYIESNRTAEPEKGPFRQRLYRIYVDPQRKEIRLENHGLPQPELFAGAYAQPARLQAVKANQTLHRPGCDVFFRWDGTRFVGQPDRGACRFVSAAYGNQKIVIDDDFVVTGEEIWSRDRGATDAGAYVYGNKLGLPAKHRRARPFLCSATIADTNGRRERTGRLHDQGGLLDLAVTVGELSGEVPRRARGTGAEGPSDSAALILRLRRIRWEAETRPDTLSLSLLERGEGEPLLSASAPAADRAITLELPGLTATCTEQDGLF